MIQNCCINNTVLYYYYIETKQTNRLGGTVQILVTFLDQSSQEIFNADGSATSFKADLAEYMEATKNCIDWKKASAFIESGFTWEGAYMLGSSVKITPVAA